MRKNWRLCTIAMSAVLALAPLSLLAQDKPDAPPPKVSPDPDPAHKTDSSVEPSSQDKQPTDHTRDEVPKRIFFIIPNFMTANDQPENQGPLTPKEKFNIAWHQYFDESAHFGNVIQAAISQAANSIPHYGQGWGAFGERFLAQEGDQFTGSMLIYGILPTALHQDPRYFRKGHGSAWSRIYYAASRVVIARTDSGKPTLNVSQLAGQLGQAGISLSYYAQQDRDLRGLFSGWAINQGYNIGWNQLKEWTPDLGAFLRRHPVGKKKKTIIPVPPPPAENRQAYIPPSNRPPVYLGSEEDAIRGLHSAQPLPRLESGR